MRFDGNSYLRYLHGLDEDDRDFRLSLRFRTFREQGLIASTNGTKDWGFLQVFIPVTELLLPIHPTAVLL